MSSTTSRLKLTYPVGTDNVSAFPPVDQSVLGILDSAAMWQKGTLAMRPDATTVPDGTIYKATDSGTTAISDGSSWQVIAGTTGGGGTAPVGAIQQYAGSSDPVDADGNVRWVICDGRALGRTTYATLFSVVASTYGSGNGSTTFNIPNLVGKYAFGKDSAGTGSSLGSSFGTKDHSHSVPALSVPGLSIPSLAVPSHAHGLGTSGGAKIGAQGIPDGTKWWLDTTGAGYGPAFTANVSVFDPYTPNAASFSISTVALTGSTDAAGGGSTGASTTGSGSTNTGTTGTNNPPSMTVNHIIRVL